MSILKEENSIKLNLIGIFSVSSIDGVKSILHSENLPIRVIWTLSLLLSTSYCCLFSIEYFLCYLEFGVITSVSFKTDYSVDFPAVTFCNLNAINFARQEVQEILAQNNISINGNSPLDEETDLNTEISNINNIIGDLLGNVSSGYDIDDMLISCYFNELACNKKDFILVKNLKYGNCYKFNSGASSKSLLKSGQPGIQFGLNLELFVGSLDSQPFWVKETGAIIAIHNQTVFPILKEEGFPIAPGQKSYLMFNREEIYKLASPFSNCLLNLTKAVSNYAAFVIKRDGYYRQLTCIVQCTLDLSNVSSSINIDDSVAFKFYSECVQYCPPECFDVTYDVEESLTSYPNDGYFQVLKSTNILLKRQNYSSEEIKKGIVSLRTNYKEMMTTIKSESSAFSFSDLLSNVGGFLGIFMGMSVLSFMELAEVILTLFKLRTKQKCKFE